MAKGDADLRVAERLLDGSDLEIAAFHLQQAVEKYLKGYLVRHGWLLRRIHELEVLLNGAIRYDPTLEQFRDLCTVVTEYYLAERYPYEDCSSVDRQTLQAQLAQVKQLRTCIAVSVEQR